MNQERINQLSTVLKRLNTEGATKELREEALAIVSNIDPIELSVAEQRLIEEGMDPQDLRHLCDVHMEVLKDELDKVKTRIVTGHVVDTLIAEHDKINEFLEQLENANYRLQKMESMEENSTILKELMELSIHILDAELHHKREEDVLFPEMEAREITGPTRIMRMEHDDLRAKKRFLKELIEKVDETDFQVFQSSVDMTAKYIIFQLRDHIYKENYILYPTALDAIQDDDVWSDMKVRCDRIGYCSFTPRRS